MFDETIAKSVLILVREKVGEVLFETGTLRLKRTVHGLIIYPLHDQFIGRSLDLYGEWSVADTEVVASYVWPGATVLDVGANIGTFALSVARAVGPHGRVIAFEPVTASYRLLIANLALNDARQAEAHQVAVSALAGQTTVPILDLSQDGNYGASGTITGGCGDTVPAMRIDDLDLSACDLLKADVEGRERDVLAGAARTIGRFRPVLYLENEEPSLSRALIEDLQALNYRLWWHAPPLFQADNWFARSENVFPTHGSLNILALPMERSLAPPPHLAQVINSVDWPSWWPDWSKQRSGLDGGPEG